MAAYMILDIEVKDASAYAEYVKRVPPIVERYGGRYIVRGGKSTTLSGQWQPERMVVLEFPSMEQIQKFSTSPDYAPVGAISKKAANIRSIAVEGFEGE